MFDAAGKVEAPVPIFEAVEVAVPTSVGHLAARCYRPSDTPGLPAVLYLHGGGFVIGTLAGVDELCRTLAVQAGCIVVSLEYRRAPESVFPAAADDCLAAYDWLEREGSALGIDVERLALAGDSAGGNLALSVCTSLGAAGRRMPRCLALAYPATSAEFEGPSWDAFEHAPVLCKADAQWFWAAYADGTDALFDPRAVPELSTTLHALPPTMIVSAEVDPLRSDYERFADVAAWAGAEVGLCRYDGVPHGFFTEVRALRRARQAASDVATFLASHLIREPSLSRGRATLVKTYTRDQVGAQGDRADQEEDVAHVPAAERRRQITEVAARIIGREGVVKATTRRIGAEAKANIGTLHYTFGSKDDLLEATFAYCWDLASELIDDALDVADGPKGMARELLTRYVDLAVADPDVIAAQYQLLNWALVDEARKKQAVSLMQQLDDLVIDALGRVERAEDRPIDHVSMGRMIGSLLDGILLRFVVSRSEQQLRADLAAAIVLVDGAFTAAVPASS